MRACKFQSEIATSRCLRHQRQGTGYDEKTPELRDPSHGTSFALFIVKFSLQMSREIDVILK